MTAYPIDALLPELDERFRPGSIVLLQAPPGAGKTTRVPLALLGELGGCPPRKGRIWMVEPRRLAARAAAERLAASLGEAVGQRIGFAVRGEQRRSSQTQLEVITDGLFLRRLQSDPSLEGVACVLFDEFHERRRDSDLAFTLLREAAPLLNPELAVMVMSATLDLSDLRQRLPEATVLSSEGRAFPVETHHQPPRRDERLPHQVLRALEAHALSLPKGSGVLVFLPGIAEIERCRELLEQTASLRHWQVNALHGQLPLDQQSAALKRCPKSCDGNVVLASAIAESSVTIDGVRLVIDSGLSRQLRFDPNTGMEGLETVPSSRASADQRRGRAGRQGPGQCIRLWSPAEQQRRPGFSPPELQLADPQPMLIELAQWGAGLGENLPWLDPPPQAALQEGRQDLTQLGILEVSGSLSRIGQQLTGLGVHPRLGLLMLEAKRHGQIRLGCDLAAILSERDPLPIAQAGCDLHLRLQAIQEQRRLGSVRDRSRQLQQQLARISVDPPTEPGSLDAAELVLRAFPQWLALARQGQTGRFLLRQGRGATLRDDDPLGSADALAVARVDTGQRDTRIQLALPISRQRVLDLARREGAWVEHVAWDEAVGRIRATRRLQLGELQIQEESLATPSSERCVPLLLDRFRQGETLEQLPWTTGCEQLRRRLALAHQHLGEPWPDRHRERMLQQVEEWLAPCLMDCLRLEDVDPAALEEALWGPLDWSQRQRLDRLLPLRLTIPSGRNANLRYDEEEVVLAVKLQEMFGAQAGPSVLEGRLPVTLELLSPAGRPLQRTQDLRGFWGGSYRDVRREMRGRYPKHPWPDDPVSAEPTAWTKRRQQDKRQ